MKHLIFTAKYNRLISNNEILSIFHGACEKANAHIRRSIEYSFYPGGFTAVVILAESHASIHTWPETGLIRVDFFSCSMSPNFDDFTDYFRESGFIVNKVDILER